MVSCMNDDGYEDLDFGIDPNALPPGSQAGEGIRVVFKQEHASKHGYRRTPELRYIDHSDRQFLEGHAEASESCRKLAADVAT